MRQGVFLALVASLGALATASAAVPSSDTVRSMRCSVPAEAPVFSIVPATAVPIDQKAVPFDHGAALPRLMVEGWKPEVGPLSTVLGNLAAAANLTVVGADGPGLVVWTRPKASFEETVSSLAAQVGAEWSFDGKTITIVRAPVRLTDVSIKMPEHRELALALIDASKRLAPSLTASTSSPAFTLTGRIPSSEVAKLRVGLEGWKDLQAFDVSLYSVKSTSALDFTDFGQWKVQGSQGVMRLGFSNERQEELLERLKAAGELKTISSQTVAAPEGTSMVLDRSNCAQAAGTIAIDSTKLDDGASFKITDGGVAGEISQVMLGQSVMLAGPKGKDGWSPIMILRPRQIMLR